MLIKCPECELQVSDKAAFCPHCGYPFSPVRTRISSKRKRLPNGFGQISFIKNQNLRKPYRAMITVGKTEEGRPISKLLAPEAYFKTYNEAYEALMEYHKDPYKISSSITMGELFDLWAKSFRKSGSRFRTLKSAWQYCSKIYKTEVRFVRARHIKDCMENGFHNGHYPTQSMQAAIRSVISSMLDYAIEYELIDHNYAKSIDLSNVAETNTNVTKHNHSALSQETISDLWSMSDNDYAAMILIQCYTGMRPQELVLVENKNINFDDWYIIGGLKTRNGKDRQIPILKKIRPLILRFFNQDKKYLFPIHSYRSYHDKFKEILPNHMPHDPRKTFVTYAKKSKMDDFAIKRIVGHVIIDVTEAAYTERDFSWIAEEMEKLIM